MDHGGVDAECRAARPAIAAGAGTAAQPDATAGTAGVSLDQRQGPTPIRPGLRPVDTVGRGGVARAEVRHPAWPHGGRGTARQAESDTAKAAATGVSARSAGDRTV